MFTIAQRNGNELSVKTPYGTTWVLSGEKFTGEPEEQVSIGVRATHMTVTSADEGDFNIEVKSTEQLGGETYIYGRFEDDTPLTLHLPGQVGIIQGERVGVVFNKEETHLFNAEHGHTLKRDWLPLRVFGSAPDRVAQALFYLNLRLGTVWYTDGSVWFNAK